MRRTECCALALYCCVLWVPYARAQDMQFSLAEVEPSGPSPGRELPPSPALAEGLRLYAAERYAEAAVQLQRVVEGDSQDGRAGLERAQFTLAKALHRLGFLQPALGLLDEIGQRGAQHAYFEASLPWLAELARKLPEDAGVAALVARHGPQAIEALSQDSGRETADLLRYLLGRAAYDEGELERAIEAFAAIAPGSSQYLKSRFLIGVSHVRRRRARPAIAAFRELLEAAQDDRSDEGRRMRDLAWLSLGRVYYTASHTARKPDVQAALLGNAVEAYNSIDSDSEYWLDALFESSWALFISDEYARALGNIHALMSPFFDPTLYPEALVLKAVVFFQSCQFDNAAAMVDAFHDRFDKAQAAYAALDKTARSDPELFALLVSARKGGGGDAPLDRVLASALHDRRLRGQLDYVAHLDQEKRALSAMPAAFRDSSLAGRIAQDVELARLWAVERSAELLRALLSRQYQELLELSNQMDTVEIEILKTKRDRLGKPPGPLTNPAGREVVVDSEHVVWPFDGEYWRDELGYYRQQVTDRCTR